MSSERAANELREHLRGEVTDGLDVRGNLDGIESESRDLAPFMIVEPDRSNRIWSTELFGPIAMLTPAETVDEAIAIANDSPYGLGATVYTDSIEHARRFVAEVETGMVLVNGPRGSNPALPFGGVKRSGIGRELGRCGVREFANEKLVVLPTEFVGAES
ncbi:aldehyde dehydrogenase family protein [Leucobacter sp. UCMA 4100]|nr:aldehyde dehydrogenase family protein [Leucobacter sp. UCMA 4100]